MIHNKPETARFNNGRAAGYCIGELGIGKPFVNRVSGRCSNGDIFGRGDKICFSYRGGIPRCNMSLACTCKWNYQYYQIFLENNKKWDKSRCNSYHTLTIVLKKRFHFTCIIRQ